MTYLMYTEIKFLTSCADCGGDVLSVARDIKEDIFIIHSSHYLAAADCVQAETWRCVQMGAYRVCKFAPPTPPTHRLDFLRLPLGKLDANVEGRQHPKEAKYQRVHYECRGLVSIFQTRFSLLTMLRLRKLNPAWSGPCLCTPKWQHTHTHTYTYSYSLRTLK